jgi:hypothetical protein
MIVLVIILTRKSRATRIFLGIALQPSGVWLVLVLFCDIVIFIF